jgi:hypothetical protein
MRDENGIELSDEQLLKDGLDFLASACEHLFEIEGDDAITALAFMVDRAFEYGNAILLGEDPRVSREFRTQMRDDEVCCLHNKLDELTKGAPQ